MAEKEYIERDGVMQKFTDRVRRSNNSDFAPVPTWNQAVQIVEDFPAANVRPVVLCKDCGHWSKENQHPSKRSRNSVAMCAWFSRNYGTIETSEGDWCSYGYRREES